MTAPKKCLNYYKDQYNLFKKEKFAILFKIQMEYNNTIRWTSTKVDKKL